MNRKQMLVKAFQRGNRLNLRNPFYKSWIKKFIIDETKGDVGEKGDITTNAVIKDGKKLRAVVKARESGIAAGLEEASFLYKNNKINVKQIKKDGDIIRKSEVLLELYGDEKNLLKIERSAVDLIQRMSGIATLTNSLSKLIRHKVPIAPTRKTQWRYLDKKAVYIGKGLTHRLALWDSILIKDNHLAALRREEIKSPIETSLARAWKYKKRAGFIEIEVTTEKEAVTAANIFMHLQKNNKKIPCLIMFDNMKPEKIICTLRELKKLHLYDHVLFEASGGINPDNIIEYSKTGVDVLSLGYLTHSSRALDIKQHIL